MKKREGDLIPEYEFGSWIVDFMLGSLVFNFVHISKFMTTYESK